MLYLVDKPVNSVKRISTLFSAKPAPCFLRFPSSQQNEIEILKAENDRLKAETGNAAKPARPASESSSSTCSSSSRQSLGLSLNNLNIAESVTSGDHAHTPACLKACLWLRTQGDLRCPHPALTPCPLQSVSPHCGSAETDPTSSIPGLARWVKGCSVAVSRGVGGSRSSDPTLLWLWLRPAPVAPIRPRAWELPWASGAASKKRDKTSTPQFSERVLLSSCKCILLPYHFKRAFCVEEQDLRDKDFISFKNKYFCLRSTSSLITEDEEAILSGMILNTPEQSTQSHRQLCSVLSVRSPFSSVSGPSPKFD